MRRILLDNDDDNAVALLCGAKGTLHAIASRTRAARARGASRTLDAVMVIASLVPALVSGIGGEQVRIGAT
ncbi:MAG: hypothetical protein ABSA65_08110 [Acidimicrobiales bacterium]|jgi:hypothetical protein